MGNLSQTIEASDKVENLFNRLGGKWPKDKRFWQLMEEVGEYTAEILEGTRETQMDELGDVCFTYVGFIDGLKKEDLEHKEDIKEYINQKVANIEYTNKDIILLLQAEMSVENKVIRKLEKRKDFEEPDNQALKRQYLILFLLTKLTANYNTSILECIDSSISKFEDRDVK